MSSEIAPLKYEKLQSYGAKTSSRAWQKYAEKHPEFETEFAIEMNSVNQQELEALRSKECAAGVKARCCAPDSHDMICGGTLDFWWRMRMALSMTLGVFVAALPSLVYYACEPDAEGNSYDGCLVYVNGTQAAITDGFSVSIPSWLDGYAAVITIFICGYNLGETNEYNFQAVVGCAIAQVYVLCWFYIFGLSQEPAGVWSMFIEIATFSFIVVAMPLPTVFKKYANGLNIWVAVAVAHGSHEICFGWQLILWGLWGYVGALVANIFPLVTAQGLLKQQLDRYQNLSVTLLGSYLAWMVDADDGINQAYDHRTVCLELQQECQNVLGKVEGRHHSTWWEWRPGYLLHRTRLLINLFYKLQSRLKAIQLCGAFEKGSNVVDQSLAAKIDEIRLPLMELLADVRMCMVNITEVIRNNGDRLDPLWAEAVKDKLITVQEAFINANAKARKKNTGPVEFDMTSNNAAELFLGCVASYCQELVKFVNDYNAQSTTISNADSWMQLLVFGPLSAFKKSTADDLLTSFKVTLAIVCAALLGVYQYSWDSTAAITIAYVVGGHVGGSFHSTVQRVLGVVMGAVFPIIFMQLPGGTTIYGLCIILFIYVTGCNYVRCGGGPNWYAGCVASFIVIEVLFMNTSTASTTGVSHTSDSDFEMLEQCCLGVCLFVLVELLIIPKHSPEYLRKSLFVAMTEAKSLQDLLFCQCFAQNTRDVNAANASAASTARGGSPDKAAKKKALAEHAASIDAQVDAKNEAANNLKIDQLFSAFAGELGAENDYYNQSLMEPELYNAPFRGHSWKIVMSESTDIRQALRVLKVMYDDVKEWNADDWHTENLTVKYNDDLCAKNLEDVMADIADPLVALQGNIKKCFDQVIRTLNTSKAPTDDVEATIGTDVLESLATLVEVYEASRVKLLQDLRKGKGGSQHTDEMVLKPMDRLKLSALMVAMRVVSESLVAITRELKFEYWDREVPRFDSPSFLAAAREGAGEDGVLEASEWTALKAAKQNEVDKGFRFIPSGNRYG